MEKEVLQLCFELQGSFSSHRLKDAQGIVNCQELGVVGSVDESENNALGKLQESEKNTVSRIGVLQEDRDIWLGGEVELRSQ